MTQARDRSFIARQRRAAAIRLREGWRLLRKRGPSRFQFWLIALLVGIASGFAAVGFRMGIAGLERLLYGTDDVAGLPALKESDFDPAGFAELELEILSSVGYAVISRTAADTDAPQEA